MTLKLNGTNSEAAPAYAGDDADTGLQCGTNELKLVTGGTARATVDSSGRVGIGLTPHANAGYVLQLDGGTKSFLQFFNDTTGETVNDGLVVGNDSTTTYVVNKENTPLIFKTNNTERMRILAAGGLTFNGDTAATNALDDYEEGTWTPGLTSSHGTITTVGSTAGRYTKIGNVVHLQFQASVTTAGTAAGAYLFITGAPFPATTAVGTQCGAAREQAITGDLSTCQLSAGNTTVVILDYDNNGVITNGVNFQSTLTYRI